MPLGKEDREGRRGGSGPCCKIRPWRKLSRIEEAVVEAAVGAIKGAKVVALAKLATSSTTSARAVFPGVVVAEKTANNPIERGRESSQIPRERRDTVGNIGLRVERSRMNLVPAMT